MSPSNAWPLVEGLVLVTLLAACGGGEQREKERGGTGADPTPAAATAMRQLSESERQQFYHLAEGSEIIPVSWVKALRDSSTGRPFLENPERFGLIPDPAHPERLPVGVTADETVDTRFLRVRMLGFNCAACHVNEITYRGNRLRIDGAPSRFDGDRLKDELTASLRHTIRDPRVLLRFIRDLATLPPPSRGPTPLLLPKSRAPGVDQEMLSLSRERPDSQEAAFLRALAAELRADSARHPAVNLEAVPFDSADARFQRLLARYSEAESRAAEGRLWQSLDADESAMLRDMQPQTAAAFHGATGEALVVARMLRDRIKTISELRSGGSGPGHGPGRVDAFGVARNRLYPHRPVPTNAPVSFPHLWGFADNVWLHWDANTNSVMERNLGQALGVGGIYDARSMRSTLNPVNIHRLEILSRQLPEPKWPSFFPPIDPAKANRGQALFGQRCAGCHVDRPSGDLCYTLALVGTDTLRAANFARPLGAGRFTDSVAPVLHALKNESYRTFRVPRKEREAMNGIPDSLVVWRTTKSHGVRSLRGVWATAPYLHNGSVPSLYELLLPPARRSRQFPIGHAEYDPVKVGFATTAQSGSVTFDTRTVGNSNAGHAYGTDLPEQERLALLEYLKTLGSFSGGATAQQGAVRCPSLD